MANNENQNNTNLEKQIYELVAEASETNDRITELTEYLYAKDREQAEKEKAEEKAQAEQEKIDQEDQEQQKAIEQSEKEQADAQTETYTELLTDIRDGINYQNELFAGQIFFSGLIAGILLLSVLWQRIKI